VGLDPAEGEIGRDSCPRNFGFLHLIYKPATDALSHSFADIALISSNPVQKSVVWSLSQNTIGSEGSRSGASFLLVCEGLWGYNEFGCFAVG
jgi:hypothetical protein